jgi:hypothetical protein
MARIRQLKPEFWTDDKVASLSRDARLLFLGLWTEADDDGRLVDSAKLLAGSLFPFDDDVTPKKLGTWLEEVVDQGLVIRYRRGAASYLHIVNFKRHQKIAHPRRSSLPPPEDDPSNAGGTREGRTTAAPDPPATRAPDLGVKGSRGQGTEGVGVPDEHPSSSNHQRDAVERAEEEEELDVVDQALLAIATAKLDRCLSDPEHKPINDRAGWLAAVIARDRQAFGHQMATMVAGGADVDLLVRTFDRQPSAPPGPTREQLPPAYDEVLVDGEWKLVEQRVGA